MRILIIIPTLSRFESLKKTVKSIKSKSIGVNYDISIVVDGGNLKQYQEIEEYYKRKSDVKVYSTSKRCGWGNCINSTIENSPNYDAYFSASDDLIFEDNTFWYSVEALKKHFPDGDGMVGINQTNLVHFCPGAINLVGRKFTERFPKRHIYFPLYQHFCVDSELWHYAEHVKKFYFCRKAKVYHTRFQDDCHRLAQKNIKRDRVLWWMKKGKPFAYWGNFNDLDYWRKQMLEKEKNIKFWYDKKRHLLRAGGLT